MHVDAAPCGVLAHIGGPICAARHPLAESRPARSPRRGASPFQPAETPAPRSKMAPPPAPPGFRIVPGYSNRRARERLPPPLSLGDTCLFRIGGSKRSDPSHTLHLASGDALVLGGKARLAFHGVDRILAGTSSLLPQGGRISLTLRRVTIPRAERQ